VVVQLMLLMGWVVISTYTTEHYPQQKYYKIITHKKTDLYNL
jgi:hypothetical protein